VAGGRVQTFNTDREAFQKMVSQPSVAGIYFTLSWFCQGDYISISEAASIARKYNKPIIVDAAAQLPPLDNFNRFLAQGADLVIFSGGKTIRGPQVSGLIVGRRDLIEACRLNNSPHIETIGRGMKISKEEIVALFTAIEAYLQHDHEQDQQDWTKQLLFIKKELSSLKDLQINLKFPHGPGYQVPYMELIWNHRLHSPSAKELIQALINHSVPIYARFESQTEEESCILIYAHTLKTGEEKEIAEALTKHFKA
jgi:L-seryl-tRNA(Ser) seleniumtransferase